MTAHALKGDRERCLAAGMDEYLSKPIRSKQLAAILETLMPNETSQTHRLSAANQNHCPVDSLIDWKTALEGVDGDRELLESVVEVFPGGIAAVAQELTLAVQHNDAATVRSRGHSLKGSDAGRGCFFHSGSGTVTGKRGRRTERWMFWHTIAES